VLRNERLPAVPAHVALFKPLPLPKLLVAPSRLQWPKAPLAVGSPFNANVDERALTGRWLIRRASCRGVGALVTSRRGWLRTKVYSAATIWL
jgi:hypothetical protein